MEIIRIPRIMQDTARGHLLRGRRLGLVPTMGALHAGHLSLVRMSREENDITIVSVFVNPLQFGPAEDFASYPRDLDGDREKLRAEGVDILFLPEPHQMYPQGFSTRITAGDVAEGLCGAFRPGHFEGVATVVAKLLNLTGPTRAYFGQKDYQQTVVIRNMVRDLDMPVEIVVCPTLREADGLALSSRNAYLTPEERKAAPVVYQALLKGEELFHAGISTGREIKEGMLGTLLKEPRIAQIQYCSAFSPRTLEELATVGAEALLAVAVKVGTTRLIDNLLVSRPRS